MRRVRSRPEALEESPFASASGLPWALGWSLAMGQLFAWGTLFYGFAVLVEPMRADLGWARTTLNGGLSLGIAVWAFCAYPVGRWIQERGGRGVMTTGSLVAGLACLLWATAESVAAYYAAWALMGVAMAGLLYEPAFAVAAAAFGPSYRRGLTLIVFVGGFASTVFIPLLQWLLETWDWRTLLVGMGLAHLTLGAGLHYGTIPARARKGSDVEGSSHERSGRGWRLPWGDERWWALGLWFTAHAAGMAGLLFQAVPIFLAGPWSEGAVLMAIALVGPAQVVGRLVFAWLGHSFSTLGAGVGVTLGLILAVALPILFADQLWAVFLFAVLFGVSNGIMTLVKPLAVVEAFGQESFARLNGALALPSLLGKAGSPLVLAALWVWTGEARVVFLAALLLMVGGGLGLARLCWQRRSAEGSEPADYFNSPAAR